jgi:hypothetical protein
VVREDESPFAMIRISIFFVLLPKAGDHLSRDPGVPEAKQILIVCQGSIGVDPIPIELIIFIACVEDGRVKNRG